MRVSIIAAMSQNLIIGDDKGLPWHLPADLKRFRRITLGKPLILGRKTMELIGKPLPGRENIVLTRRTDYAPTGVRVSHSVEEALRIAAEHLVATGGDEVMVIGGEEVYRQFLTSATRFYLTVLDATFAGTSRFPRDWHRGRSWHVTQVERVAADDVTPLAHTFYQFDETVPPGDKLPALFGD
jgi:dihydrofolate reductase